MKTSTKLLSMFSAFCFSILLGLTANAQSITVSGGLTASQMAQALVGTNVTVTNATFTGAAGSAGLFNQASSTFPLTDGIILTSGSINNALGPNNSTGATTANNFPGDADLNALIPGYNTFDACVLEFDITSNCNTVTFDYIFASEEYLEYGCSNFNDVFGFLISGPGYAPNTNIALVPGTTTPVSINNVINSPATGCVSNPTYYVDNAAGVATQYDGYTVVMTATATIQPCQTYHVKIVVGDAGDSVLDSAIFLKGGGINCSNPNLTATATTTGVECGSLGSIDVTVSSGTGPFTYAWTGPNGFTSSSEDLTGLAAGDYTVDINGSDCLSSGQFTFNVPNNPDVTAPVISNCPTDVTVTATSGCSAAVNFTAPTATDNCGTPTLTSNYSSGDVFPVGTTAVTYTATDGSGNTSTCTFNVTVNAAPMSVSLTPSMFNGGVNIRCYGQNSGWADADVTGGCGPYTYDWVINGTSIPNGPDLVTGLYAGSVTVTVTDANGTSVTQNVTLIQNPPVQSVPTATPILCYGGTSTITVTATGGTAPYAGTNTYTNMGPGTYQFTVADANGCRDRQPITITQPDLLDVTATPTAIICNGDTSAVTVAATGGTMPYTGTGVYPQVAGSYSYTVTDANGCTETVDLTINEPAPLTALASYTPILCYGGTSQVTVSVISGTEPYTGTGVFTEYAGTYTYQVYDYNLCEDTVTITIPEPPLLVVTATAGSIDCNGGSADVVVSATGGTAPYTGTGTFNETAGTYTYTVTDANGCTDSATVTLAEPTPLSASISSTGIDCFGGTADITVTATGGTAPYTGTGIYNVGPGSYSYVVTDANGCSFVTDTITIIEPTQMTAYASCPGIACNGGTTDLAVTAFGGTPPYTGTGVFTVTAGTYTYTITDANGCTASVTHTITEPAPLVVSISSTGIDCSGGTADVTVSATGGTAPYTGTGTFNVGAGTYTYTVTDANGCSTTETITVAEPAPLVATATASSILCNGGTADVTVTATGGTAPYTGTGTFNESAGTYTYTVTDANGCTATTSVTLTEPSLMTAYASCPGIACNGGTTDLAVTAFGGTPPYTGTGVFTVTAGTYTYTVTDANGCTASVTHTITEPAPLVVSISSTGIDCSGGTADVTVSATGGTAPYTGTGTFNVGAGTYTYTVTDANGCSTTETITVAEPAPLVATATASSILCNGGTADVTVTATGGTAPYTGTGTFNESAGTYTYTVTDANGCTATTSVTLTEPSLMTAYASCPVIDCNGGTADMAVFAFGGTPPYSGVGVFNVGAGTYTYTVTDANGCTATVTHTVTEPAPLVVSISSTGIDCNGGTADVTVSATGGTAPYTGTGTFNVGAGTYTYTVTDANGCSTTETITVAEPAALVATATAASILCNGGTADVTVTATGGTAPYTGTGTFNESAGTYTYTVTDANGCTATTSVTLTEPSLMTAYASCPGIACNGGTTDLAVTAFGGTPPYTGTGVFTVTAGTYTYTITDANGCTASVTHTITEPAPLVVSISSTGIDCNGGTADVTVSATGGTAPYTGTGTFNVGAGTYTYTVTDANGCSTTETITVAEPAALSTSATSTSILCNGGSSDITITAAGGTPPYTGTGVYSVTAGTYTYTVTDANGCSTDVTITVTEPTALSATATVGTYDCSTDTAPITVVATGGTTPYTGVGVFNEASGNYTFTVTDANGCTATTNTVTVDVQYFVDLTCPGDQVYACTSNQSCGSSSNGATVSWDEPTASSFSTCNTGCGPVQQICGYNYIGEYGGSRYYRSTSSNYTWQEANTAATLAGGYLVSIGSAGENQFVQSQLGCSYAWIGYNDQNSEGSFEWTSGENVTYENWANYEPNNGGGGNSCGYCGDGDYVAMRSNGKWYDKVNCNDYRFVMEIPCGNPITITQTSGPANGSFLSGGTTEVVTYVATDQVTGATATCSFTITVEECVPEYCESSAACTAYEWIDQVSLGSIGNQSGNDNGYGDYTSMTTVASPGDVVNLQLTPGFSGASYTETWRVWVDWNYDGDFYDQGELVYQGYGNSTLNGSFTVPSWATTDLGLRVRVSMRWNCYAGPCSYFQYGEVEDYTLFVNGGIQSMAVNNTINGTNTDSFKDNGFTPKNNVDTYSEVIEDVSVGGIGLELGDIYPNPVLASNGLFNLNIRTGQKTDVSVRIVDLSGKVLLTEVMQLETGANKRQLDVTGFARGSYLVEVISENLKETTQLVVQ